MAEATIAEANRKMGQAYDNQQEADATMAAAELRMEQALDKEEKLDQ